MITLHWGLLAYLLLIMYSIYILDLILTKSINQLLFINMFLLSFSNTFTTKNCNENALNEPLCKNIPQRTMHFNRVLPSERFCAKSVTSCATH